MPGNEAEASDSDTGDSRDIGSGAQHRAASTVPSAPASDVADAKVTSAEWKKAAQDEFVRRVQDAVGGTLFEVRPAKQGEEGP